MSAGPSGTRTADFNHEVACVTFGALEHVIVQAVAAGELDSDGRWCRRVLSTYL